MQIYNVYQSGKRLYIDEKENPDNKIVVNKYENEVTTLRLVSDGTLPPRLYWALRNPKLSNKYFILKLVNNEDLIVGTDISAYPGLWDMLLIGTDEDYIIEGTDIDQSRLTYISDHFGRLFVRDNFLEELDFEEQCSPTFRVFYDEIIFQLDNKADKKDIPDKLSDLENDTNFISGVALKDDGEGNVKIVGTTFEGSETEEGGGGNYNLPVANETTLGGVKPLNKTEDMTLDVGVDKNGRLFAKGKDITVDSELDKESQNPVQNKVITAEVKALREENEALEQKNAELEEKNAELESSIEKLQIKSTTDKAPFHHITDSANMKVVEFGMEGKTEQETTSGKNLYSGGDRSGTVQTYKFTVNPIPAGTYTLSANVTSSDTDASNCLIALYTENGTYFKGIAINRGAKKSISFTTEYTIGGMCFYASNNSANSTDDTFSFTDIQIEVGSVATEYEPYTGGQPSPNPTHPQDIKLAGVLNEETGRYEHKCCVVSENFFDINSLKGFTVEGNTIIKSKNKQVYILRPEKALPNTQYYISYEVDIIYSNAMKNFNIYVKYTDGSIDDMYISAIPDGMATNKNKSVESIMLRTMDYDDEQRLSNLMISVGTTKPVIYTPHASQQFTLTSDRPLTMWDKLVKRDGVYGWSVYHYYRIMNGTEQWYLYSSRDGFAHTLPSSITSGTLRGNGVCNWLRVGNSSTAKNMLTLGMSGNSIIYACRTPFYDSALEDKGLANWKAHLNENPLEFYAQTNTEQSFIPLPDEEQTLLNNLETYYGVTNVYNEQGCPMWLTYVQSPQICMENVNKKIEEINSALLSIGANV